MRCASCYFFRFFIIINYETSGVQNFAPRCYTCKTAIIEERFISLDDPALGKRTYHEQHFFCAECGDPFLAPSSTTATSTRTGELNVSGDGVFEDDDVGFTVYKGHPYCEACHVRLRLPKCKRCKRSIRDGMEAVEALGGKWCWECFVCAVGGAFIFPTPLNPLCFFFWIVVLMVCYGRDVKSRLRIRRSSRGITSRIASLVLASS